MSATPNVTTQMQVKARQVAERYGDYCRSGIEGDRDSMIIELNQLRSVALKENLVLYRDESGLKAFVNQLIADSAQEHHLTLPPDNDYFAIAGQSNFLAP